MDADIQQLLESCVQAAKYASNALPVAVRPGADMQVQLRLHWIERQLANVTGKLDALLCDIDSGLSLCELGFSEPQDMQDFLGDLKAQIANLTAMANALSKRQELSV